MKRLAVFSSLFCLLSVLSIGAQDRLITLQFNGLTSEDTNDKDIRIIRLRKTPTPTIPLRSTLTPSSTSIPRLTKTSTPTCTPTRTPKQAKTPTPTCTPTPVIVSTDTPTPTLQKEITVSLNLPSGATKLKMALIPAGTFLMGSPSYEQDRSEYESPQRWVTISKDFYMGIYEITNAQYQAFQPTHDSGTWWDFSLNGNNQPVSDVSWHDAITYCEWLNQRITGLVFRLPTEAEWEYACRGGTTSRRYWGDDLSNWQIGHCANIYDITANDYYYKKVLQVIDYFICSDGFVVTSPVGNFIPNDFGLYDMQGNVREWCYDWYDEYPNTNETDPFGPLSGSYRILRGGGWQEGTPMYVRSAYRAASWAGWKDECTGFRIVADRISNTQIVILSPTPISTSKPTRTPTSTPTKTSTPLLPSQFTGKTITISLNLPSGAKSLDMVLIPAGTFMMGSPDNEQDREENEVPQHQVTITKPFYMGKYEVTQAQWEAVMNSDVLAFWRGKNLPVEYVSWNDCHQFIQKMNQLGQGTFRLPTEAEWEYACRAGTTTRYYWGNDSNYRQITQFAWFDNNAGYQPHEVGTKLPNAWNLFDMSGNVYEWCQDRYGNYTSNTQVDPTGSSSGSIHVIRGGYWLGDAESCRSGFRDYKNKDSGQTGNGFRLVKNQ